MLLAALEQLALQQQDGPRAGVGGDQLADDRGAGPFGDSEPVRPEVVAAPGDGTAVPHRKQGQGAAVNRTTEVEIESLHDYS